jgi:polysaccharide export outer membrane protein
MKAAQEVVGVLVAVLLASVAVGAVAQSPPAASTEPGAPGNEYLIGPGDTLQVFVWRNPELSVTVPVRPDGRISTPLVENMTAVGRTPTELARAMEEVLGKFVRSPQVNVIVIQATSTLSQVKVMGQVTKPQALPYREGMKVSDAVLAVGGLTQFAAANRARIVRSEGGTTREIPVRLGNLLNKGDMGQDLPLRPGDALVVPQTLF